MPNLYAEHGDLLLKPLQKPESKKNKTYIVIDLEISLTEKSPSDVNFFKI